MAYRLEVEKDGEWRVLFECADYQKAQQAAEDLIGQGVACRIPIPGKEDEGLRVISLADLLGAQPCHTEQQ